jgi:23S rRNA (cytidine1920-2'-O)/16S rRNA (cytidine1409-2'-O)-methyltransferase
MKKRLDLFLLERFPQYSRQQIQAWIMRGLVFVDGVRQVKPGLQVAMDIAITLNIPEERFVSRAGYKLEKALDYFGIEVAGLTALDAGISTGGFTDCLLQRGVKKVFGIDVGYGQVHEKIRSNTRLTLMERINLRHLEPIGELVDLVTLDLSFISVLKVMSVVATVLKPEGILIVLIKPQFEAERADVGRGGIIKNPRIHERVIARVTAGIQTHGFSLKGVIDSPILGGSGNKEFLAYFIKR